MAIGFQAFSIYDNKLVLFLTRIELIYGNHLRQGSRFLHGGWDNVIKLLDVGTDTRAVLSCNFL